MKLETTRFNSIDIDEKQVVEFPDGLYGFEKETRFILLPFNPNVESPMEWMQSILSPHLAFAVTDPHLYVPDYRIKLLSEDKKKIELQENSPFCVKCIVTIPENYTEMTANLVAPVVINRKKKIGKQFVLTSMQYDTRHYLLPEEMRSSVTTSN